MPDVLASTAEKFDRIVDALVQREQAALDAPPETPKFTGDVKANALVANLERYPHGAVIACIMDRRIKAERAWRFRIASESGSAPLSSAASGSCPKRTWYTPCASRRRCIDIQKRWARTCMRPSR